MNNLTTLPLCILEEIGFEGLEGVTIEGLWKRLSVRIKVSLPLNSRVTKSIWDFILEAKCLQFYLLPNEREPLKLFDRIESVDPFFGANEVESCPYNNYKYNPISTSKIRGSCEHYESREELAKETIAGSDVQEIEERYGRKLVIVASQSLRDSLLLPSTLPSDVDISILSYCILERLGRARYNGELSQGKFSLSDIGGDPIAFHFQKKKLMKHKLIECQTYSTNIDGMNTSGQLIHLPRFFALFKPRHIIVLERIIEILKAKPNFMAEYQEVKDAFDENTNKFLRRLYKTSFFQKYVLTDTRVPHRAVYPNATEKEWKTKHQSERTLHVLQLKDANVDPSEFGLKKDVIADDDDDDIDGENINYGFLDTSNEVLGIPILHQIYEYIKSSKENGVSEHEVGIQFGQSKLAARALVRKLIKQCNLEYYTVNKQRQNVRRYVLSEFNVKRQKLKLLVDAPVEEEQAEEEEEEETKEDDETFVDKEHPKSASVCDLTDENINVDQTIEPTKSTTADDLNKDKTEVEIKETLDDILDPLKQKCKEIDNDIIVKIVEVQETEYCRRSNRRPITDSVISERNKSRVEFMLREIKSRELYDDPTKLYANLVHMEELNGLTDRMCKKTFNRLLTYMCLKKLVRLWSIQFQYQARFHSMMYVSSRNVTAKFSLMKSCIDQAKSKFRLNIFDEVKRRDAKKLGKMKKIVPQKSVPIVHGPRLTVATNRHSLNYGATPKFIRLRTLHEFLFYLVYEFTDTAEKPNQEAAIEQWKLNPSVHFDDIEEMPTIWNAELGWKMFIPPLVGHNGFDGGWCLLSDCIFRLPLSIFVKIINISHEVHGLNEFLAHPIKKHFLIKDLPLQVQQLLFERRKHIATLHELLRRLICIGLIKAGPHRSMKDEAFYYLNHHATLYDTSSSEQGLYYVTNKEYPMTCYNLNTLEDVYTYWDAMHSICMSTKLNRKSLSNANTPYEKLLPARLMPYIKPIQPSEANACDNGEIPGDGRGAAGLDSFFFAHLERNWSFNSTRFKPRPQMKMKSAAAPMRYNRLVRVTRDANLKKHESRGVPVPLHKLKTTIVRRRMPVRKKTIVTRRVRHKYDDIDRIALQNMNKLRVDWNQQEDNCLLLCKVAQMYLNPNNRLVMPTQVIRDLMHWSCKSLNKTALACRRRIAYITKKLPNSDQINSSVLMCLNEIKENKSIQKRFGENLIKNLRKIYLDEGELFNAFRIHFIDLVHTLSCQFYNLTNSYQSNALILPKRIQEFHARFIERTDSVYDPNTIRYDEPTTVDDIKVATVVTLIHSTMCCCHDKTSMSIQLYEIYKDFPEKLLSSAMHKVRSDQLITHNKITSSQRKAHNRCLPLSSSSYHLSATYQQQMTTKISYNLFDEAFSLLHELMIDLNVRKEPNVFNPTNSEICFFISELLHRNAYDVNIEIPKRLLLLDPSKRLPDESFQGICARFHEIFNYIPKIDLVGNDDMSGFDEFLMDLPNQDDEEKSIPENQMKTIINKLENLPSDIVHFFCIINSITTPVMTKPRNQLELDDFGRCPLDCMKNLTNPFENLLDKLLAKREIWNRLNPEQQELGPLPAGVLIDEFHIVAIYNFLIVKGATSTEEQRADGLDKFKLITDIVDEMLLEHDKEFIDEDDFGAEYDLRSDMKRKLYDGSQINDKIHKFHDFLCINTCKLSLMPMDSFGDIINLNELCRKRDDILGKIIRDRNWSADLRSGEDFVDLMIAKGLTMTEVHIAIDIFNYIDSQGEMGVSAATLAEKYEDKEFLQTVLNHLNELKLVMKTGVCEITFVHWKHIKPWVINTYHLKRLERESVEPTTKTLLQFTNEPSTSKRKPSTDKAAPIKAKKSKIEASSNIETSDSDSESQDIVGATVSIIEADEATEPKQINTKTAKKFSDASIEYGTNVGAQFIPHVKKTFPLKIAPWIRVNGSINRRVLDKYAGTILLHCIENIGLTLFSLCTRFHYLLPIHVNEIVEYLEEFGCLTKLSLSKRKPVTLFSNYDDFNIKPATSLDDFKEIFIEPTIDAVTKMSIFIGNKKYKEDFI